MSLQRRSRALTFPRSTGQLDRAAPFQIGPLAAVDNSDCRDLAAHGQCSFRAPGRAFRRILARVRGALSPQRREGWTSPKARLFQELGLKGAPGRRAALFWWS